MLLTLKMIVVLLTLLLQLTQQMLDLEATAREGGLKLVDTGGGNIKLKCLL